MTYNPKIYIRGYGNPTYRLIGYTGRFALTGQDAAFKRSLILRTESSPAEVFELLSGDAQSGDDVLALSGTDGLLLINTGSGYRLSGQDATLIYSIVKQVDPGSFLLTGNDAVMRRSLVLRTEPGAFAVSGQPAQFRRALRMVAEPGSFVLTGNDVELALGNILFADPGAFVLTGNPARLLRGYRLTAAPGTFALSGQSIGMRASRRLVANPGTFSLTGYAAEFVTDTPIGLSGDMDDTGNDAELLSGDMQSGTDLLIISQEGI